jgi:hypothetical protein
LFGEKYTGIKPSEIISDKILKGRAIKKFVTSASKIIKNTER